MGIAPGQYWIVEGGIVIQVVKKGERDYWVANRIDTGGCKLEGVGVHESTFERQISAEDALTAALAHCERMVRKTLNIN